MTQPSTFNPANDTLEAHIDAWKITQEEVRNLRASLKLMGDPDWADRLGSPEELQHAQKIILRSAQQATKSLSTREIQDAVDKKLISQDEHKALKSAKASIELNELHSKKEKTHKHRR